MLFAPPIVSQAYILRTRFWSLSIFLTEKAREIVTERGNPSGIATTITVIPKIKKFKIYTRSLPVYHSRDIPLIIAKRIRSTTIIRRAEYKPNLPMSVASFSSFCCKGVGSGSSF